MLPTTIITAFCCSAGSPLLISFAISCFERGLVGSSIPGSTPMYSE